MKSGACGVILLGVGLASLAASSLRFDFSPGHMVTLQQEANDRLGKEASNDTSMTQHVEDVAKMFLEIDQTVCCRGKG